MQNALSGSIIRHSCSGIILAGGVSRRMGRDKAWIELGGHALVERAVERLKQVCAEIIIVANAQEAYRKLDVRLIGDVLPGKGALGGIYSGLSAAQFDRAVVVACDMPFLNVALLDYMLTLADDYDAVIPSAPDASKPKRWKDNAVHPTAKDSDLHPLHAVYTRRCMEPIAARLRGDDLRLIGFHPDVRVRVVSEAEVDRFDPQHLSLFNVNTPEQLALAETLVEQGDD